MQQVSGEPPTLSIVYDQITAPIFPATVPQLAIWTRLFYSAEEAGRHDISLTMWDTAASEQIGDSSGSIQLPARPERRHPSNDVTFSVTNAQIPHAGEYEFRLNLDGEDAASIWLTVLVGAGLN